MRISTLLMFLVILCACSARPEQNGTEDSILRISGTDLLYEIPFPATSIVAEPDQLGTSLAMCVVDTLHEISALLFSLPNKPENQQEVEEVVRLISHQNTPGFTCTATDKIKECNYIGTSAWSFESIILLRNSQDSIKVLFNGRIFENKAFVVTANCTDSINFDPYIYGLKRI